MRVKELQEELANVPVLTGLLWYGPAGWRRLETRLGTRGVGGVVVVERTVQTS